MSLVKINWKPDSRELRKFGLTVLIGFCLIAGLMWWKERLPAAKVCVGIGLVFGGAGMTGSKLAMPFYLVWMGVGWVMGNIMSRLILTLFYYGILTPLSFVMRLTGRDRLGVRRSECGSHWVDVPDRAPADKSGWERQF
jgi:uncharacterized membrane protein AbrB (regulator of aidB expression)